jgi:hypothetical protein
MNQKEEALRRALSSLPSVAWRIAGESTGILPASPTTPSGTGPSRLPPTAPVTRNTTGKWRSRSPIVSASPTG